LYVVTENVDVVPGLPPSILCSHCYLAFPQFKVKKGDKDEEVLRYAARLSSGRDLAEEFVSYGVWTLAHEWGLVEVRLRPMPFLGDQMVWSPAFTLDLRVREAATFVQEVESEAVKIVGKYVPKMEMIRS
jgi:hypothetical protein